jgi:hypothetical protein
MATFFVLRPSTAEVYNEDSPSMKFGALSKTGLNKINELIGNKSKWE